MGGTLRITPSLTLLLLGVIAAMTAVGPAVLGFQTAWNAENRWAEGRQEPGRFFASGSRAAGFWCDVPCRTGTSEFVIETPAGGATDLLISTFAAPSTSQQVRVSVATAEAQPSTLFTWHPLPAETEYVSGAAACALSAGATALSVVPGEGERTFHGPVLAAAAVSPWTSSVMNCCELCRGARTVVYCEASAVDAAAADLAQGVATLLERELLPRIEGRVGPVADVDGDGLLAVVITPRVRLASARLSAFVRAADFQPGVERPWSNQADVMYLDPRVAHHELPAILAHELTHMAQFSHWREQFGDTPWPLPDWLLEGHAHAVEVHLTGNWSNLHERLTAFVGRPESCPLVIPDAAAAGLWRDAGCRGATASFCLWLTRRFGAKWWRRLAELAGPDDDAWEREFGRPFAELYREWTLSLASAGCVAACTGDSVPQPIPRHELRLYSTTRLELKGTATAYCRLPQGQRLKMHIDGGDRPLQVTLVNRLHSASGEAR
jgi:hypothetical protein